MNSRHTYRIPKNIKDSYLNGELSLKQYTRLAIQFNYGLMKAGRLRPGVKYAYGFEASNQFENNCLLMRKALTHAGARWATKELVKLNCFELLKVHVFSEYFDAACHGDIFLVNYDNLVKIDPRDLFQVYLTKFNDTLAELKSKYAEKSSMSYSLNNDEVQEVKQKIAYVRRYIKVGAFEPGSMTYKQYERFLEQFEPFRAGYEALQKMHPMQALKIWFDPIQLAA